MAKDMRPEQLVLLRFEKKLAGLAAFVAGMGASAATASTKVDADAAAKAYEDIRQAVVHLADVTSAAHAALQSSAGELGVRLMAVGGGGTPKDPPSAVVRSLLGLG